MQYKGFQLPMTVDRKICYLLKTFQGCALAAPRGATGN